MEERVVIVVDNAIRAASEHFKRAYADTGLVANFMYASNFSDGARIIAEQNGRLAAVVTELLDMQSTSVLAEVIFATRGKGDSGYIPIIAHTNNYSDEQERFARVLGIDAVVQKGSGSSRTICRLVKGLIKEPEKYKERPLMIPVAKPIKEGKSYFPFENNYANLLRLRKGVIRR